MLKERQLAVCLSFDFPSLKYFFYTDQTSTSSWFPLPSTWQFCGMNVGHWTPEADEWYLRHHKEAAEGTRSTSSLTHGEAF